MAGKGGRKGPSRGTGGKGRSSLQGKKSTLPAEQRHWYSDRQRARAAKRPSPPARPEPTADPNLLVGRNPVVEALRAGMPATRLYLANSLDSDDRITEAARLAGDAGVPVVEESRADLDRRLQRAGQGELAHQGIMLRVRPFHYVDPNEVLDSARNTDAPPLVVALDGVTDPHNLGAVARSAAAFGAHGLVIPERRAASVTTAAWKTSAGTLARLPVARVTNLTRTLRTYQDQGMFAVALDGQAETRIDELSLVTDPLVLVLGAEGEGVSRLVRQTCDAVAAIPMHGTESLNASVAAGVTLYEIARRRSSRGA
ncbi:23S rRNA (guanosine(2251)-2'-O)-methyltransferase RlmB [Lipingzhangella sp. LS1_29]|uniref:23S rRNA (Guanosine(2251)-2'-O)-methyltransferase RlmB n=1 Tax=Lipingzhangella rawalii TaxID=2055835 RepID=A0ABU2H5X2_9ACTN|nr:23S rRNA (guanosine(2251)-2'-O)-methyltransferase RlmB [Lipingzhangella rawalii]MDS1270230.1 23S rRNA (guanosine(2251)-2'-O)-methyltransferase RlmB [Lipingzhangella rawalii]